jgi:hypothetical protein
MIFLVVQAMLFQLTHDRLWDWTPKFGEKSCKGLVNQHVNGNVLLSAEYLNFAKCVLIKIAGNHSLALATTTPCVTITG